MHPDSEWVRQRQTASDFTPREVYNNPRAVASASPKTHTAQSNQMHTIVSSQCAEPEDGHQTAAEPTSKFPLSHFCRSAPFLPAVLSKESLLLIVCVGLM